MATVYHTLSAIAQTFPSRVAVTQLNPTPAPFVKQSVTYEQLLKQILDAARVLQEAGVVPGDVVMILNHNDLEFVVIFLAVTFLRAIASPLNPAYTPNELQFYAKSGNPRFMIMSKGQNMENIGVARQHGIEVIETMFSEGNGSVILRQLIPVIVKRTCLPIDPKPDDICLFLHTSGTTGNPKGVPLTHANLTTTLKNIQNTYRLNEHDTTLLVMPLFHVHGLVGVLLSTLGSGGHVVIQSPKFSASRFWKEFLENNCTWYSAVPTIHQILLRNTATDYPGNSGKLRFIRSCSASLAPATLAQLETQFKAPVLEAYAMTEASHQVSSNPPLPAVHKPGSVGIPQGVEICIKDEKGNTLPGGQLGEVCVRGKNITQGYWRNPEAIKKSFFEDGWFRTGDQGYFDKDGYLFLTGRIKELINRGGEKIAPLEIDAILLQHPAVVEAISFGVPDKLYGEEVHAAVVNKSPVTEEELLKFCASKLSSFKCPKKIYVANDLPRTATGKIQRNKVAEHFYKSSKL